MIEMLRDIVGAAHVLTASQDTRPYFTDWRRQYTGSAECVVRPASTAEVARVVELCAAHAVATHHKPLQPVPQWRIDKVNRIVPGDMKAPVKAYLWALQNPHLTAVISNLWDETYVKENLALAGRKVTLRPA